MNKTFFPTCYFTPKQLSNNTHRKRLWLKAEAYILLLLLTPNYKTQLFDTTFLNSKAAT